MKSHLFLILLSVFVGYSAMANDRENQEILFEEEITTPYDFFENNQIKDNNRKSLNIFYLQKGKFKFVNGDIREAEYYFNRVSDTDALLHHIKNRYLAMIKFIEGKYSESLKYLTIDTSNRQIYYPQLCLLRLLNFMALNDLESLKSERTSCQLMTQSYSNNDQLWLDTMLKLKMRDLEGVDRNLLTNVNVTMYDNEMSKLWLKTGLYLNKEQDILKLLANLSEESYQSKRLREVIAFMYLRTGNTQKALSFIDDIDSANAENIKGNINLSNKKYELAFGHFKLALQKKYDSNNALEKAIPLAWTLGQWSDGLTLLTNTSNKNLDQRNKHATKIAFLIRDKKFDEAKKELMLLRASFLNEPPFEVIQMESYVNMMSDGAKKDYDKRRIEETTEKACKSFDGMSCYISLQLSMWENLGKTAKREDPVYTDTQLSISSLKEKATITPLKESVSLDQKDIEELDSNTITIKPE